MISDEIRREIQHIVRGTLREGDEDSCSKIRNLLCKSFGTGPTVKKEFESRAIIKEQQACFLKSYARDHYFWFDSLPAGSQYLIEGGESKVFLTADGLNVIKTNDASYYATWDEFFNNLVLHNLFFPYTAYLFLGFIEMNDKLCAVIQQPYIEGEQPDLEHIEGVLRYNGFTKVKRQDYYHEELGIALEDMHDENVIAQGQLLFFIDTVFYIMEVK